LRSWVCRSARGRRVAKKAAIERWKRPPKFRVRFHNRCRLCGRPRAYMRQFGMCRICFRKLAAEGRIPGVTKSSW
jgi:small subunit ribosomal protein S14